MRRSIAALCTVALVAMATLFTACSEPPMTEIDRAQGAIDAARAVGAEQYASAEFTAATTALQQAHEAVAQRDYRLALSRAIDASERAQNAARQAADGKARARSQAEVALAAASTSLQQLRAAVKSAEAVKTATTELAAARATEARLGTALQKARALLKEERYVEANAALTESAAQVTEQIGALNEAVKSKGTRRRTTR